MEYKINNSVLLIDLENHFSVISFRENRRISSEKWENKANDEDYEKAKIEMKKFENELYKKIIEYFKNFGSLPFPGHTIMLDEGEFSFYIESYTTYEDDRLFIDIKNGYDLD